MTTNKKELLIYKLVKIYKELFKDRRKLKDLSFKQGYKLAIRLKLNDIVLNWYDNYNKHKLQLSKLPYTVLKELEHDTKHIHIRDSQVSDIIILAIKYEEWDNKYKRSYRNLKISKFFNFLSDKYNYTPTNFYKHGLDLETSKLIDLEDNLLLKEIVKVVLK